MKRARFEVYKSRDGWRWRLKASNGRVVASGEAYTRKRDAERAKEAVWTAAHDAHSADLREMVPVGQDPVG